MPPRSTAAAAKKKRGVITARSNYSHTAKEASKNSDAEGFMREVGVHNPFDANADWIRFAPLLGKNLPVGALIADNGHGMSRNIHEDDAQRDPEDSDGNYPRLNAFFDVGNSTRIAMGDCIGRKGQGSKLALQAKDHLCIVTKTAEDSGVYTVVEVDDPKRCILESNNPKVETEQVEAKDILDLVMAENTYAGTNHGLASARDPKDKDTVLRLDAIKEGIVNPWLEKPTGTLIIVTGLCDADLQDLLENLDNFNGFVERDVSASSQQPDPGSDYCKLAAYLRFNTVLGHPLHIKTLEEADFLPKDIKREAAEDNDRGLVPLEHRLNNMDFKLLTKGGSKVRLQDSFQLHKVPVGYPYVPFTRVSRKKQGSESNLTSEARDGNPLTVEKWSNASFQERYLDSFLYKGKRYVLVLDVCGKHSRYGYWQMMNRTGGRKDDQLRSGRNLSDVGGVVLYADGVYVSPYPELLKQAGLEDYSALNAYIQHWDLKIIGEFDLQSSRNVVSAETKEILKDQNFIQNIKRSLDSFRTRNQRRNVFERLVRRVKNKHAADKQNGAMQVYNARAEQIEGASPETAQPRLMVKLQSRREPICYLQPPRQKGEENSVIMLYGMLQTYMPDDHFDRVLAPLKPWWPAVLSASGAAGVDCFGVDLGFRRQLNFQSMSRNVPLKELTTIEFKSTWRIPDKPPKDSDKQGVCYNHSFVLTDLLVCWDFKWPANHQVGCRNGGIIVPEHEVILQDTYGHTGVMSERIEADEGDGNVHIIPDALKGFAFFIKNVQNHESVEAERPVDRQKKLFTRVVALKQLIQATFAQTGVGSVTWSPPETSPESQGAQQEDEESDTELSAGKVSAGKKSQGTKKAPQTRKRARQAGKTGSAPSQSKQAASSRFTHQQPEQSASFAAQLQQASSMDAGPSHQQENEESAALQSPRKRQATTTRQRSNKSGRKGAKSAAPVSRKPAVKKLPSRAARGTVNYCEDSGESSDTGKSETGSDTEMEQEAQQEHAQQPPSWLPRLYFDDE